MYVKSGDCKKYHQHLQIIPQHSNDFNINSKKQSPVYCMRVTLFLLY